MRLLTPLLLIPIAGCQMAEPVGESDSELSLASETTDAPFCIEPTQVEPWLTAPEPTEPGELFLAGAPADDQVEFNPPAPRGYTSSIKLRVDVPAASVWDRFAMVRDVEIRDAVVRVVAGHEIDSRLRVGADVLFKTGQRSLDDVELIQTYAVSVDARGRGEIGLTGLELVAKGDTTPLQTAQLDPGLTLTSTPGSCVEHAMVRFGPLPWDMPAVKFPDIDGCTESDCIEVAHGWLRTHHNTWRANQLMQVLREMPAVSRSVFWDRPGLDENQQPVSERTKPSFWWGKYDPEHYDVVQEGIATYWAVIKTARIDIIDLTLQCKYNAADPCQTKEPLGYHTVKGYINVCNKALDDGDQFFGSIQEAVTRTVGHEALHHVWVNGYALSDTASHWHGNSCATDHQIDTIYHEDSVRHMATYEAADGDDCNHRKKLRRRVEGYSLFAYEIGETVRSGEMWWWPEPTPPTPQPPTCIGDPGCLCSDVPNAGAVPPDGDFAIDKWCGDLNGETTCQTTTVNASSTVGLCVICDEHRGPGCECDFGTPCDEGSCFGDDTQNGYGVGRCYDDLPPSWACAADCETLFNDPLAYCYNDHQGGARCMDNECEKWEADDCYAQDMLCRNGACVVECEDQADCVAAGYPSTYECKTSGRCEPYWY